MVDNFGDAATVDAGFGPISVDVPADRWVEAVTLARDGLDCGFFDWLSAVDELDEGFRLVCHLASRRPGGVDHLIIRTLVPREVPTLPSVAHVFRGARWHERETHEMFGIEFTVDGEALELAGLLLPEGFEGHPLRKDFILASRVAKPFPGAKEPGESEHDVVAPSRRRTRPPGVPTPDEWGPRPAGSPGEAADPRPTAEPPGGGGAPIQPRSSVAGRPGPSTVAPPPPSDSSVEHGSGDEPGSDAESSATEPGSGDERGPDA